MTTEEKMAIKYTNIEFENVSELIEYQKMQGKPVKMERKESAVIGEAPSLTPTDVEKNIQDFYKENVASKNLGHGKRKQLAKKIGIAKTRLGYLIKRMRAEGKLPNSSKRGKRTPNKYKPWTETDDKQLLQVAKGYMDEHGTLKYSATGKIAKEIGRTKSAVNNRLFFLKKESVQKA